MASGIVDGIAGAVGHTPLIRLRKISELLGRDILGKAEFLNPAGSIKDRTALGIIHEAEGSGALKPGFTIVEGTAGNTGIGLASLGSARGYRSLIVMPDNQAPEKYETLRTLGAELVMVPATKFADPKHFYHTAKRLAEERPNCFWADQFENTANANIHYQTTGPEIWEQTEGRVDAFVLSAGTGGTIGGASRYLKEKKPSVRVVLADPAGSGLYSYVKTGDFKCEGTSITEGIGIMRLTANFKQAIVDDALQVADAPMVAMAHWLASDEGLCLGTSAALNVWAAAKVAETLPKGARVVTLLCDGGQRYQSRLYSDAWLKERALLPASRNLKDILT